jgi:hypothetical protein
VTDFAAPFPHGPIEELFPDVFLVTGSFRLGPGVVIPRNMLVLRDGGALTIVNSVRLSEAGERALEALGEVRHVVKLGHFHTLDDPYYRSRFSPTYWAPKPSPDGAKTELLVDGAKGPTARASAFVFTGGKLGEAALVVEQPQGNLLITCDSVQNWTDTRGCSLLGGLVSRAMGFLVPAKLGPIWVKKMTDGHPAALRPDFDRLLARDFQHLIAGHGSLLRNDAKAALERSVAKQLRG